MEADDLWMESYQGEVLGERLFGRLASREQDPERRRQLNVLVVLERATKELAEPVFERRALDRGDTGATIASADEMADALTDVDWEQFLGSFEPIIGQFLDKYRRLVDLASDEAERTIALAYVAHEQALATFSHRALGQESGDPLEAILALPHVGAAKAAQA